MGLKGKHDWLKSHCAFGLDSTSIAAMKVIEDDEHFNYEAATSCLNSAHLRNEKVAAGKKRLVSHLNEYCYDILLSKQHNVSESPGYECMVRQYGGRQD